MKYLTILFCFVNISASSAQSVKFENCDQHRVASLAQANVAAIEKANRSAAILDPAHRTHSQVMRSFENWFGADPDGTRMAYVRATYLNIARELSSGKTKHACVAASNCAGNTLAYMFKNGDELTSHYCPRFFQIVRPQLYWSVVVHEISHFNAVRGTHDYCYGEMACKSLARTDPEKAIRNADSYSLFSVMELSKF